MSHALLSARVTRLLTVTKARQIPRGAVNDQLEIPIDYAVRRNVTEKEIESSYKLCYYYFPSPKTLENNCSLTVI